MSPAKRAAVMASLSLAALGVSPAGREPASDRLLVLISDLHFGVGRQGGQWHPTEDFRWLPAFRNFLNEVHRQGSGKADLVIAGDAFELWQSLTSDCRNRPSDWGCTETEVLNRLRTAIAAHSEELRALGEFAGRGDNRVVFVPGNHDAGLLFPSAAAEVVAATATAASRVLIEPAGYWRSSDQLILVEHGHQIGAEVNKFRNWPRPFIVGSPQHLQRSWGEQFVQEFYNQYEAKYPTLDNVTEEGAGLRYAKELEGWSGLTLAFGKFLYFYTSKLSAAQVVASLGEGTGDVPWDLLATRKRGLAAAIEALQADNPLRIAFASDPKLLTMSDFSDEELTELCDGLVQTKPTGAPPACIPTAGTNLGAGAEWLARSKARIVGNYLIDRQAELARSTGVKVPFKLFVYAHTHLASSGFEPLVVREPDWNPRVVNTGAWQRTATPEQLSALRCRVPAGSSLVSLPPEELPACYSSVWVRPYSSVPASQLQYWVEDQSGGHLSATCEWKSPCR